MNTISNILNFPGILSKILYSLIRQKAFITKNIDPILAASGLPLSDINKIKKIYGLVVPAVLGYAFSILRGKPLTQNERLVLTYLGSITGLYDDFFDELHTRENHILELTNNPNERLVENIHESLFVKFYSLALKYAPSPIELKQKSNAVFEAQLQSKLQHNSKLSKSQLREITFLKGGTSFLFYRCALNNKLHKAEEKMIYKIGSLIQLENDIFDVYKDYQNNISTLANTAKNINELREIYTQIHDEVLQLLGKTSFPRRNKISFSRFLNLIVCRGYVCLDCLEKNEKLSNNVFSIKNYSRKSLICDMEIPGNMIKTIKYYGKSNVSILK